MPAAQAPGAWPSSPISHPFIPPLLPEAPAGTSPPLPCTGLSASLWWKTACITWGCFLKEILVNLM